MAKARISLSDKLKELCANVYFQPPGGHKLIYPCIIYSLKNFNVRHANNNSYMVHDEYEIHYITRNPDDPVIREIAKFQMCRLSRTLSSDNLHNYYYTIFY